MSYGMLVEKCHQTHLNLVARLDQPCHSADKNIIISVLHATNISREQEVKLRRHSQGIAAISVLSTNMAVLGEDNRVSLWVLGTLHTTRCQLLFQIIFNFVLEM